MRPWPDGVFDAVATNKYDVARRSADDVADILASRVSSLARALGVPALDRIGSESFSGGDEVDTNLVAAGRELRSNVTQFRSGDLSIYLIHARHVRDTEVHARHERLLVQRGGLSVCEVVVFASLRRVLAGDDELDQAHVRFNQGLDTVLGAELSTLVEQLRQRPQVVLDPDHDLAGADLGGGRSVRSGNGSTGRTFVTWTLQPTSVAEVEECFDRYVTRCFEVFALGDVPTLETTHTRRWNEARAGAGAAPDGAPVRSFSDLRRSSGVSADLRVRLSVSTIVAHWDDNDIDHVSVALDMRTATDRLNAVASGRNGESCTRLRIARPTSGAAIEELWTAFGHRLADEQ